MNKNLKKKFSIFVIYVFVLGILGFGTAQENQKTKVNSELSLVLPAHSIEIEELLTAIRKMNTNVIFLRSIELLKNKKVLFAVSRYENSEPTKIDTVFYDQTVNVKADNLGDLSKNYNLISFKRYKKANVLLYLKVSRPMEGQCSVMYYFMKNNFSNVMYEIKMSGAMSEMEAMKTITEKIALSVEL